MTQDFKDKLLKYLTGNLSEQSGTNEPIFDLEETSIANNIKNDVTTKLTTQESATNVSVYGKIYNELYENFVVYGRYTSSGNYYGFIYIVDRNLDEVSLLTEFESGTKIYPFIALQQDEDGNFYALTHGTTSVSQDFRVCLLNNVLGSGLKSGVYKVRLRQSYFIPNATNYRYATPRQNRIIKIPNESTYYITLHNLSDQTLIIEFVINVGSTNEWTVNTINYILDTVNFAIVPNRNGDNNEIYFYGLDISSSTPVFREFLINSTVSELYNYSFGFNVSSVYSQIFSVSVNSAYISVLDTTNYILYLYLYNNSQITNIWSYTLPTQETGSYLYLESKNNITFLKLKIKSSSVSTVSIGILQNNQLFLHQVNSYTDTSSDLLDYADFYIVVNFNLIAFYVPNYDLPVSTNKLIVIYNISNYNGAAYENVNSMIPNSGVLYDDNGNIIFARNLYNLNINGNTTISTIEVPNTFLNDVTIGEQDLISQTNGILNQETNTITTNIYENLDINFFNTLIMKNDNTPNEIINNEGASRLNNSISQETDYSNATANKIRINYQDGTSLVSNVGTPTITNGVATYTITIYVPKAITNIEIISNDEATSYQTITGTFNINKYYTLTQDVRVE